MIKVLHVFGRMNRGGAEMRTIELMPLLAAKDVNFDFCTLLGGPGQLDEKIRQSGSEILPCPLRPGLLSFPQRFSRILHDSDYDIVHSHVHYFSGYIVRLAHKAGIKGRILHFRNTFDGKANSLPRRFYRAMMRKSADKHATGILAVCHGAMEFGWGKDWQKDPRAQVLYNGLDLSRYEWSGDERENVVSELGLPDNAKLIISVGRMHRQKGYDVLLDAAAEIIAADSTFHFLLVGDGALRPAIEAQAKALDICGNVHLLGVRSDVPRLLKASNCLALPSRWEGLPGVVLEALAADLPVVATDLPGVREIAKHTDLISIVPVEDSDALADAMLQATTNIETRRSGKRTFPPEFDLHNCAEELFEIYSRQLC